MPVQDFTVGGALGHHLGLNYTQVSPADASASVPVLPGHPLRYNLAVLNPGRAPLLRPAAGTAFHMISVETMVYASYQISVRFLQGFVIPDATNPRTITALIVELMNYTGAIPAASALGHSVKPNGLGAWTIANDGTGRGLVLWAAGGKMEVLF